MTLFDDVDLSDETFDLAEALAIAPLEDAKSLLVMGGPGVGKGVFVERWKNALLAAHPDAVLYAVNPKPDARESYRWEGFKSVLNVIDEVGATQALASLRKIEAALKQRLSSPSDIPFALIIDEYNTLSDLWTNEERAEAAKLIKRIARQGRSLRCRLLLAVHSPNADELSMTASDRACFTSVALARKNNQQTLRIAASNSFLFPGLPKTVIEQIQARKGQPEVLALCSEYDRMLILPTVSDAPKPPVSAAEPVEALSDAERLERLYAGSENELKPDLEKVFDYIISFMPSVGDKVKARDLYKDVRSKTVGVTADNAAAYMQDLATVESDRFKFDQQTLNTGSVSQFLVRINQHYLPLYFCSQCPVS